MANVGVLFPDDDIDRALNQANLEIIRKRKELLEKIGIQVLQFAQLAYDQKSRGQVGDDGIQWDPIQVSTILARLRRAGHIKSKRGMNPPPARPLKKGEKRPFRPIHFEVSRSVKGNSDLFNALQDSGVEFRNKKGKALAKKDKKYGKGTLLKVAKQDTLKQSVSVSGYMIGVDRGLQRSSASPGFHSEEGGNVFEQNDVSVTVGYGMNYSGHFDLHRKLFPDILPEPWFKELEEMVAADVEATIVNVFTQNKLS